MSRPKYVICLPSQSKSKPFTKDFGFNRELAFKTAQLYFDADESGFISLVEKIESDNKFAIRLPSPQYLSNPANYDEPWIYLSEHSSITDAIAAAQQYGANSDGKILIADSDFLEEFAEVHLVLRLKRYSEYPELDLEGVYRGGIIDEITSRFETVAEQVCQYDPGSVMNLIKSIDINFDATDATLIC